MRQYWKRAVEKQNTMLVSSGGTVREGSGLKVTRSIVMKAGNVSARCSVPLARVVLIASRALDPFFCVVIETEERIAKSFFTALYAQSGAHVADLVFALTRKLEMRQVIDDS